uniref:Uncharacterized protein n=1 Tax=Arundo donax TaxID=35708 RepID=A0A0A8Z0L0_ARUDO
MTSASRSSRGRRGGSGAGPRGSPTRCRCRPARRTRRRRSTRTPWWSSARRPSPGGSRGRSSGASRRRSSGRRRPRRRPPPPSPRRRSRLAAPRRDQLGQQNQCLLKMGLMYLHLTIWFCGSSFVYQDTLILGKLCWRLALIVVRKAM